MFKRLLKCVGEFKLTAVLTVLLMTGEVIIECFIPFLTANLINSIQSGARAGAISMGDVLKTGATLIGLAVLSLACGGLAAFTSARHPPALQGI